MSKENTNINTKQRSTCFNLQGNFKAHILSMPNTKKNSVNCVRENVFLFLACDKWSDNVMSPDTGPCALEASRI